MACAGFLLGTRQTVLETFNGGKTWEQRFLGQTDVSCGTGSCAISYTQSAHLH